MKLLYLSVHAILEYDECKLFEELGVDWFALGSYIIPRTPVDSIRPPINRAANADLLKIAPMRDAMPKSFVDQFDTVVVMHGDTAEGNWIEQNWENMKHKRVIWRTIGQSNPRLETKMQQFRDQGMQIVRMSEREANIPNFAGADDVIHFYKDPEEFGGYTGKDKEAITFAQNMIQRGENCHFDLFEKITQGFNSHVYGPKNENAGALNGGFLTYEEMRQKMSDSRVYIYTGTQPSCYVLNFIEAWMTGIPIVAIGPEHGNSLNLLPDIYQIPEFISTGVNGICSDSIEFLRQAVGKLMSDHDLAKQVGQQGREKAIALFGKEVIKSKWKKFLSI